MTLYCHDLTPSAADTKVQKVRQYTKQADGPDIECNVMQGKAVTINVFRGFSPRPSLPFFPSAIDPTVFLTNRTLSSN